MNSLILGKNIFSVNQKIIENVVQFEEKKQQNLKPIIFLSSEKQCENSSQQIHGPSSTSLFYFERHHQPGVIKVKDLVNKLCSRTQQQFNVDVEVFRYENIQFLNQLADRSSLIKQKKKESHHALHAENLDVYLKNHT